MNFAMEMHKNQKRKYINVPYFSHLAEVVGLLSDFKISLISDQIAWLHDCMEDCDVKFETLISEFGDQVATGVKLLSDLEKGNRKERKELQRKRIKNSPWHIQNIKACDIISNTPSIKLYDPKFYIIYKEEVILLLNEMKLCEPQLREIAFDQLK